MTGIEQRLSEFLNSRFDISKISRDDDIFSGGYVSSLFAMQLVMFLESEFRISISDSDLELENFKSVANINKFVSSKLSVSREGHAS